MLKKGLVLIAVPFLFQSIFIAALWNSQSAGSEARGWEIHTRDVIAQAALVARYVTDAQNDVRGLIVTGDASLSEAYRNSARQIPAAVAKLRWLVRDNPGQRKAADEIGAKIVAFMALAEGTHRLASSGRTDEAAGRVREAVRNGTAREVRAGLDRFLAEEERLDGIRRARMIRAWSRGNRAIVGGALASVAAASVTVLAFSRGFARRVAVLGENARRLAEGKPLAPPIGGGDELSRLDSVFHTMAAALAEKDRENEMFIFSVSHDLRSPLVNLQGFSTELSLSCDDLREALAGGDVPRETRDRVDLLLDRDMATSVQFIRSAVTRLSAIIDALLRLSRAGRVEYRWQTVDVPRAVTRVVEALGATVNQRKAEVVVRDLPEAWGDPTAVEQVFANLVGNSLNYLDPARPGRIEVGAEDGDAPEGRFGSNLVTYYVKDNGLGVPKAYHSKLFLAFQRLHPEAATGEGIGLALVRRVVERHGGKVWFESAEGTGSTFYLTLPAPPAPGQVAAESQGSAEGRQGAGSQLWPTSR